jgi:hypothetical protein
VAVTALSLPATAAAQREATTSLFSRDTSGGVPNGASTNPVISGDRRTSQLIAFESQASDLVRGDTNDVKDLFVVRRAGSFGDKGTPWRPGNTQLVSRGPGDAPANGPSFDAAVDGNFEQRARCVAFLSDASNLVRGDTNGQTDAFLARAPSFRPQRVSLPRGRQTDEDTSAVAVSGDCSRVAFVAGDQLWVKRGSRTKRLPAQGPARDPSFAVGRTNDLVFGTGDGVRLSKGGFGRPRLVARGGRNPAFDARDRRVIAYETRRGGHWQIGYRVLGRKQRIATAFRGKLGNRDSREPVIVNSGYSIGFESDATNLSTKVSGERGDGNGVTDAYYFTATKSATIIETVDSDSKIFATGGRNPSTSYYRNYVVYETSGHNRGAPPQIHMRYLGGI